MVILLYKVDFYKERLLNDVFKILFIYMLSVQPVAYNGWAGSTMKKMYLVHLIHLLQTDCNSLMP